MNLLAATIIDVSVVLALGLLGAAMLRQRSASLRHAILATAIAAASAMPVFELLLPQVPILGLQQQVASFSSGLTFSSDPVPGTSIDETVASGDQGMPWVALFLTVWGIGATVIFAGLVASLFRLRRLRTRCTVVEGRWRELTDDLARECGVRRQVAVLQSEEPALLVTCGVFRPAIILPASASAWTEDRAGIVLRHELAHIRRHDAAIQLAGEALRMLHWIDPLAWIASRRLRQESEYACDDAVLRGGVEGTEYATHLLEVARQLSGRPSSWAAAHAIAHPSTLERRIVAMLQPRNRASLNRRGWMAAALGAVAVAVPLAAIGVTPQQTSILTDSQEAAAVAAGAARVSTGSEGGALVPLTQQPAAVAGRVIDQLGAAIPGVQLTLTDPRNGAQLAQKTNASGGFTFRDLPPGRYELVASAPAFATVSNVLTVGSGDTVQRTITLPLGMLKETITLTCSTSAAARAVGAIAAGLLPVASAQQPPSPPVRVGGKVQPPLKLKDVRPTCPANVPPGETTVTLTGRIGVDGFINDVKPAPASTGAAAPAELTEAAMEAVRQWKFSPTLLNGQQVAVEITANITFRKS